MTPHEASVLTTCLDDDERDSHAMQASGTKPTADTLSTATAKAIAAGISLKAILAAALSGYISGGLAGAIAAVLALLATP